MKSKYGIIIASLAAFFMLQGCKDDSKTSEYKTMTGSLTIGSMPSYIRTGSVYDFDLETTVELDEKDKKKGLEPEYEFSVTGGTISDQTATHFRFTAANEPTDATVKAVASYKGYISKPVTLSATVVNKTSVSINRTPETVTLGGSEWQRVNCDNTSTGAVAYLQEPALTDVFGAFYTSSQLEGACPAGYTVPTLEQWKALVPSGSNVGQLMADASFNGKTMWNHYVDNIFKLTDSKNFSAIPCGYATIYDGEYTFSGYGSYACFWAMDGAKPVCVQIYADEPSILTFDPGTTADFAASLRCVRK